ncbi:MAG TPA: ribosome maturation factor RimM [Thermotogota bacterium]|nr:ribosome maturation factor RimM [Thermotogota bacterium]HPJ88911.1 ribosome maturation factor RimM [Thermotogota bacterium]HPR95291.1 ribosome maturation factor RimM [Thermotogota bacterium]
MINELGNITSNKIAIGRIATAHGLKGEVKVKPYTNYDDVFVAGAMYLIFNPEKRRHLLVKVDKIKDAGKHLIVHFDGFDNIEAASRISGFEIFIDLEKLPDRGEDTYYFYQLMGCTVIDETGTELGKVFDVQETGSADVLCIFPEGADPEEDRDQEIMIPVVRDYVTKIDKVNKVIHVIAPIYSSTSDDEESEDEVVAPSSEDISEGRE